VSVLSKNTLRNLIAAMPPLLKDFVNIEEQLQPNGFDITLREVAIPKTPGRIERDNSNRLISSLDLLRFDENDIINNQAG
jgi:dUTP pyrophosphatase